MHHETKGCAAARSKVDSAFAQAAERNEPLVPGVISLVEIVDDGAADDGEDANVQVVFVRWEKTVGDPRQGRRVRLDSLGRVIYNVPYMVPVENFAAATTKVIVPRIPVVMLKATARFRVPMPAFAVLLRRVTLARRCSGLTSDGAECVVCTAVSQTPELAGLETYGADVRAYRCRSCAQDWHEPCAAVAFCLAGPGAELDRSNFACPACQVNADDSDCDADF